MLTLEILNTLAILAFSAALLWAAVSDIRHYLIPNTACMAIAALFGLYVLSSPGSSDWAGALIVAGIALLVGFVLYLLKVMGAGDVKLFAASALWAGPALALPYGVVTALAGGVLSAIVLIRSRVTPARAGLSSSGGNAPLGAGKVGLPYGVAIAAGGLFVSARLLITSMPDIA